MYVMIVMIRRSVGPSSSTSLWVINFSASDRIDLKLPLAKENDADDADDDDAAAAEVLSIRRYRA